MRSPLIVGMSFLALPFLIVESLYVAIILAVGVAIGATVNDVGSRGRHKRAIADISRTHRADLQAAFWVGVEAEKRKHN